MRNRLKTILAIAFVWGMAIQTNAQEMNKVPTVKLNNGMEMPQLGVGTFLVKDDAAERVCHAIKVGFRLIDTAQGYGNEKEVGEGICRSGIDRRELFITTKVNTTEMRGGTVRQSLDKSLADLGTDYIDLVLIHWPVKGHIKETWQILEEYVDKGENPQYRREQLQPAPSRRVTGVCTHTSRRQSNRDRAVHDPARCRGLYVPQGYSGGSMGTVGTGRYRRAR